MNKEKIIQMINKRIKFDPMGDPNILDKYWRDLTAEFINGTEDEIIEFLSLMNDEQLRYSSEIFDDIYDAIGESSSFLNKLKKLQEKRPNIDFGFRD